MPSINGMGGFLGGSPSQGLLSRFGNVGKVVQEGFKSVFAPEPIAQGWRDVLHLTVKPPAGGLPVTPVGGDALAGGFMTGGRRISGGFMNPVPPGAVAGKLASGGAVVAPPAVTPPSVGPVDPVGPAPVEPVPGGAAGGMRQGLAAIGSGMLKAARNSAIVSALVSTVFHGYKVATGKEATGMAAGGIVADTVSGTVAGAVGAATSGLAMALAGTVGLTVGLPMTLIGLAGGLVGSIAVGAIFKKSGAYDGIRNGIARMFGQRGNTIPNRPGQGYPSRPGGTIEPYPGRTIEPYPGRTIQPYPGQGYPGWGYGNQQPGYGQGYPVRR